MAVAVSRDGRWVVTGGVGWTKNSGEKISAALISLDNTLLVSGSEGKTAQIWNLDTGKLVAGPFGES